ncbi:hypothetical protein YC2023_061529 [Brassica napus]
MSPELLTFLLRWTIWEGSKVQLLSFYYMKEQLLLLGHFILVNVVFVLNKGKPGVDIFVIEHLFLVTLVREFKIQNRLKLIGEFLGHSVVCKNGDLRSRRTENMCKNEEADEEDFRTEKTMSSRKQRASRGDAKGWHVYVVFVGVGAGAYEQYPCNRNGVKGEVWSSLGLVQREGKSYKDCLSSFRRVLRSQEVILWLWKIGFKSRRDLDTIWRIFG